MNTNLAYKIKLPALALSVLACSPTVFGQLSIPIADGTDGALVVGTSTNIDLSKAGVGLATGGSANPGFGTYDSNQWAVVFKYTSVVISNGAIVTFSNHPTHAPVIWLVSGNVTNNGTINLDGSPGNNSGLALPEPGPGGFRGGDGFSFLGTSPGFGPGGGNPGGDPPPAATYAGTYGSQQIIPLIGGSGGAGVAATGGAGGGAMLIAATGTINIGAGASIHATGGGGVGGQFGTQSANGSGGGIRLVASQILGTGTILANGGGSGRIELECTNVGTLTVSTPNPTSHTLTLTNNAVPQIFPLANSASVVIVKIVQSSLTNQVSLDPTAAVSLSGNDDLRIVTTNMVTIQLQTSNFPTSGTVAVYVRSLASTANAPISATFDSGNTNSANWHVTTTLPPGHTIIQARAFY